MTETITMSLSHLSVRNKRETIVRDDSHMNAIPPYLKVWPNSDHDNKHAKEIALFRAALKPILDANGDQELVKEIQLHDRACMRFLRARQYNIKKSVSMFQEALNVRKSQQVDRTLDSPFILAEEYNRLLCRGFHGYDRCGRPIYIEKFGSIDLDRIHARMNDEQRLALCRYQAEYVRKVIFPAASQRAGHRIDQLLIIIDMQGFGRHLIRTKQWSFIKALSTNDQLLYPERMGVTVLINVPSIFSWVWKIASTWLDDAMKQKIQIYSHSAQKELLQLIDEQELPAILGGKCRCGGKNYEKDEVMKWDRDGCLSHTRMMSEFFEFSRTGLRNDSGIFPPAARGLSSVTPADSREFQTKFETWSPSEEKEGDHKEDAY